MALFTMPSPEVGIYNLTELFARVDALDKFREEMIFRKRDDQKKKCGKCKIV